MTNHPENLVAWLDDELPEEEAAAVTLHVESCADCRRRAHAYAAVTEGLVEYRSTPKRRWVPVAAVAAAIAAAIVLAVALWPKPQPRPVMTHVLEISTPARPITVEAPPPRPQTVAVRVAKKLRRPSPPAAIEQAPVTTIYVSVVRVAIPADDLFPPGTLPPGFAVYADLALASDGTPAELRLFP